MSDKPALTREIDGRKIDIHITEKGHFWARPRNDANEHGIEAPSLDLLVKKLTAQSRAAATRLAIPAVLCEELRRQEDAHAFTRITITGIHASNRNVLFKRPGGKTEQESGYSETYFDNLTDAQIAEAEALSAARRTAMRAWEAFVDAHRVQPKALVTQALTAKGIDGDAVDVRD